MKKEQNLTTIYWKEDYKNKLTDYIMKEEKTTKYLKNIIKYFEENNIQQYNKFDKRDLTKIEKYLQDKKMIYYNHCQDNFSISCNESIIGSRTLYIYINNEQQYNSDIEIYSRHLDGSIEWHNVMEQAKNRLLYVETRLKENKKIYKNFDKYFKQYNNKVREFKKFIDTTKLNNIIDIYIYAREQD